MNSNQFELTGKVNYINVKATENGTMVTKMLLSKKIKEDLFNTFPVTCFNEVASITGDSVKKGDYVHIEGYLNENKFKKDENDKSITIDLIASKVQKVKYDTNEKKYVLLEEEKNPWED